MISSSLPTPATFIKQVKVRNSAINPLFERSILLNLAQEIQTDLSKHHELLHTDTSPDHVTLFFVSSGADQATASLNHPPVLSDPFAYTEQADHLVTVTVKMCILYTQGKRSTGTEKLILKSFSPRALKSLQLFPRCYWKHPPGLIL